MKKPWKLILISVLVCLFASCSNTHNIVMHPDSIAHETRFNEANLFNDNKLSNKGYVGVITAFNLNNDQEKLISLAAPSSKFFTMQVDKDKVNYIVFSLYLLNGGKWEQRPITMIDVYNDNEMNKSIFSYDLLFYDELDGNEKNTNKPVEVMGKLNLYNDAIENVFSLSFPFEFSSVCTSYLQISGMSNEIIYAKLNQEVIVSYHLYGANATISSPNTYDFVQFKESNATSDEYASGIVLTLNYTDTIPSEFNRKSK